MQFMTVANAKTKIKIAEHSSTFHFKNALALHCGYSSCWLKYPYEIPDYVAYRKLIAFDDGMKGRICRIKFPFVLIECINLSSFTKTLDKMVGIGQRVSNFWL